MAFAPIIVETYFGENKSFYYLGVNLHMTNIVCSVACHE